MRTCTTWDLFAGRLLRIPRYPHYNYVFHHDQLENLWIALNAIGDERGYYAGEVVLEPVFRETWERWETDSLLRNGILAEIDTHFAKPVHIVEGQQELTTIWILIQAIFEFVLHDQWTNTRGKMWTVENYCTGTLFDDKPVFRFGYEASDLNLFLRQNMLYEWLKRCASDEENCIIPSEETINQTDEMQSLTDTKTFFKDKLTECTANQVNRLMERVNNSRFRVSELDDLGVRSMIEMFSSISSYTLRQKTLDFAKSMVEMDNSEKDEIAGEECEALQMKYHEGF